MIYANQGITETIVYSGQQSLNGWTITITGKEGRDRVETVIDMSVTLQTDKRYYLYWLCPTLAEIEYFYEIKSDLQTIDKGILRYGMV